MGPRRHLEVPVKIEIFLLSVMELSTVFRIKSLRSISHVCHVRRDVEFGKP
jgi:hypothetical protein